MSGVWCVLTSKEQVPFLLANRYTGTEWNPSKIAVAIISVGQCFVIDMRHGKIQRDELVDVPDESSGAREGTADILQPK